MDIELHQGTYRHLVDLSIVEFGDLSKLLMILFSHEIDRDTLPTESSTTTNPANGIPKLVRTIFTPT